MNDLGVIRNDSTILLELLTKEESGDSIWADNEPTASVSTSDPLSIIEVANVKLNKANIIGQYTYELAILPEWEEGIYIISYSTMVNGIETVLQETFTLQKVEQIAELEIEEIEYSEVEFGDNSIYIMPSSFQIEAELVITETGVTIKPKESLKYNHTYTLVIDKGIESLDKQRKTDTKEHITFTSEYSPIYATPLEVKSIMRNFFPYFTIDEVYSALRDAGEKAHVYKDLVPDANNSRFKKAKERDTYYFALTKYQAFEASRVLLTKLLMNLLQGDGTPGSNTMAGGNKPEADSAAFTLGDFTVSSEGGASAVSLADLATLSLAQKSMVEDMIRQIEQDLKFWQDSLLGHHRRSYAKPTTASFRSDAGSPGSREF